MCGLRRQSLHLWDAQDRLVNNTGDRSAADMSDKTFPHAMGGRFYPAL
jgi:hypothetical protein